MFENLLTNQTGKVLEICFKKENPFALLIVVFFSLIKTRHPHSVHFFFVVVAEMSSN
jgi:hypothetical protein